jgi:catechol 2,3-dioxygenase-like lactoylglutathione lyase family enzyme
MIANAKPEPVIPVSDLDRAASFYGDTLGLSELQRYDEPAANPMIRYELGGNSCQGSGLAFTHAAAKGPAAGRVVVAAHSTHPSGSTDCHKKIVGRRAAALRQHDAHGQHLPKYRTCR